MAGQCDFCSDLSFWSNSWTILSKIKKCNLTPIISYRTHALALFWVFWLSRSTATTKSTQLHKNYIGNSKAILSKFFLQFRFITSFFQSLFMFWSTAVKVVPKVDQSQITCPGSIPGRANQIFLSNILDFFHFSFWFYISAMTSNQSKVWLKNYR